MMKKKGILIFYFIFFMTFSFVLSQTKREFRGVWIATVANIDWPTNRNSSSIIQKNEFIEILNKHKEFGINAVVAQVRPSCDAFYKSEYEPWSEWLTGVQGNPPEPYYDPLEFMIEETHKRGMEFHAWFNPYRAVTSISKANVSESHISNTKPEWIITYGDLKILNPGLPEVREYVTKIISDVVRRYDIDAVHFDDYFYPYKQNGLTLDDKDAYERYGAPFSSLEDWRRDNVNQLVKMVSDSIKANKSYVKFGISPFAIWRNKSTDILGSETNGGQAFDELYADILTWLREGWLDYVAPQIYWSIGFSAAPYEKLIDWWNINSFNSQLFIGQAAYRNGSDKDKNWLLSDQMPRQIRLARSYPNTKGFIFFSSKSLTNNMNNFSDSLQKDLFKYKALIPEMPHIDSTPPNEPRNLKIKQNVGDFISLSWESPSMSEDGDSTFYYSIYRMKDPEADLNEENLLEVIQSKRNSISLNIENPQQANYYFTIKSLDRLWNESKFSSNVVSYGISKLKQLANKAGYFEKPLLVKSENEIDIIIFLKDDEDIVITGNDEKIILENKLSSGKNILELNNKEENLSSIKIKFKYSGRELKLNL